jgi:hypothetical protein
MSAINRAKEEGDIELLREIASDPSSFILRQGWTGLDLGEANEIVSLRKLFGTLNAEIVNKLEALNSLRESSEYELYQRCHSQSGLLDEVGADLAKATAAENSTHHCGRSRGVAFREVAWWSGSVSEYVSDGRKHLSQSEPPLFVVSCRARTIGSPLRAAVLTPPRVPGRTQTSSSRKGRRASAPRRLGEAREAETGTPCSRQRKRRSRMLRLCRLAVAYALPKPASACRRLGDWHAGGDVGVRPSAARAAAASSPFAMSDAPAPHAMPPATTSVPRSLRGQVFVKEP